MHQNTKINGKVIFGRFFVYFSFFSSFSPKMSWKNANILKVPRSSTEIFKTLFFYNMIVKYTNFQLLKVALFKENDDISMVSKSQVIRQNVVTKTLQKIFEKKLCIIFNFEAENQS